MSFIPTRLKTCAIATGVAVVLAAAAWCGAGAWYGARLARSIRNSTGWELNYRLACYRPPWGLTLLGVRLNQTREEDQADPFFSARRLTLKLASRPRHGRPLAIDALKIDSPCFNLAHPVKVHPEPSGEPKEEVAQDDSGKKPSDRFVLRDLQITNVSACYGGEGGSTIPLELRNIDATAAALPGQATEYGWQVSADSPDGQPCQARGTWNIDQEVLDVSDLAVHLPLAMLRSLAPLRWDLEKAEGTLAISGTAICQSATKG